MTGLAYLEVQVVLFSERIFYLGINDRCDVVALEPCKQTSLVTHIYLLSLG